MSSLFEIGVFIPQSMISQMPAMISPQYNNRIIQATALFKSFHYLPLCDLAGLKKPLNLDGESLVEVVKGKKDVVNIKPYAVSQYPRVGKMGYSLRDGRYRYTVWLNWKDKKTDTTKILAEELYDYAKDPDETVNVAANSDYADALHQMKRYWEEYKKTRIVRNEK